MKTKTDSTEDMYKNKTFVFCLLIDCLTNRKQFFGVG